MSATKREHLAVGLLADLLRRVNQASHVLYAAIRDESNSTVGDLRAVIEPTLIILNGDLHHTTQKAMDGELIDGDGNIVLLVGEVAVT